VPLQKTSESYFALPLTGSIAIANTEGSIHIYGWYEPRVRLVALCRAYSAARLREVRLETTATATSLAVRSAIPPVPGLFADRSGTIDYTANVPESARLKLQLADGEVSLQGLRGGEATISLTNGRITALNCFAKVAAYSRHGVMEVFFAWFEDHPAIFDYRLGQGRIAAILPATAQFRVEAATANGRIGNGFGFKPPGSSRGETLRGATAPNPPIVLHLHSGGGNISIDRAP
jgi:hypothetical protein